jgi:hypothetical protein
MQIKIIIKHKYSSSHQKQICSYHEERKDGVFVFISTDQERNTNISRTHPRLRVIGRINTGGQVINKKNLTRREEGRADCH